MFEHVTILISFIFAVAVTHLFTSTTELIWAHDRVRISWLQIVWMLSALIGVMIGWMGMFYLSKRTSWDAAEVAINFAGAGVQYFTCSLIYARVRPYVGCVFAGSCGELDRHRAARLHGAMDTAEDGDPSPAGHRSILQLFVALDPAKADEAVDAPAFTSRNVHLSSRPVRHR